MKSDFTKSNYLKLLCFLTGLVATVWFIIRVIPKPSRALYPCQRAAFPIASSFIIWLAGSIISVGIIKYAKRKFTVLWPKNLILIAAGITLFILSYLFIPSSPLLASEIEKSESMPVLKAEVSATLDSFKSTVAVVRSEKAHASEMTANDIQKLVEEAVEMAGGLADIVHNGDTVVLKPNLVCDYSYAGYQKLTPGANGIVTDYRVIQAVVNIVNGLNPSGKIFLLEGSAKGHTSDNMATVGWNNITGLDGMLAIEENSGAWYEYNSAKLVGVDLSNEKALYPDNLKPNKTRTIYQNKIYHNADVLICLPVLKNHGYTGITGAVKCVGIGGTPGKIYGTGQTDEYPTQRYGIDHGTDGSARANLHKWIHDFYACRPIDFVIMDGIQGSDRGPVAYGYTTLAEAQRNMRMILAGRDAIAVDAIESLIMGHDPQKIPHLVYLHNDGYGCANPALIRVLGEIVEDIRVDFKIYDSGLSSKFYNFSSRNYQIKDASYTENQIVFSLTDSIDLCRIEVSVDGQKYPHLIVGHFNQISIPLDEFTLTDSIMSIVFVDKYLNTLTRKYYSKNFTGINNLQINPTEFSVYPNPTGNYLNLKIPGPVNVSCSIKIFSMDGKLALSKDNITNALSQIDVSTLDPGQYVIRLNQLNYNTSTLFTKLN